MLKVNYEEFVKFGPCWLGEAGGEARLKKYFTKKKYWSALDILNIKNITNEEKLWSVLREELIPAPILHEFACRCAEKALELIDSPDPRSIEAIRIKRLWIEGKATDYELAAARGAAWDAARDAARAAARAAARDAAADARDWQVKLLLEVCKVRGLTC